MRKASVPGQFKPILIPARRAGHVGQGHQLNSMFNIFRGGLIGRDGSLRWILSFFAAREGSGAGRFQKGRKQVLERFRGKFLKGSRVGAREGGCPVQSAFRTVAGHGPWKGFQRWEQAGVMNGSKKVRAAWSCSKAAKNTRELPGVWECWWIPKRVVLLYNALEDLGRWVPECLF